MTTVEEQFRIKNDTKHLSHLRRHLLENIRETDLQSGEETKIVLAVDEAVTNIIEHGYDDQLEGWIDLRFEADQGRLKIVIRDMGKRFDPNSIRNPDIVKCVREGQSHGLGIFLIRQIMDEVRYRFQEGQKNQLTLIKYFSS